MTAQNEEAEELMRKMEKEEDRLIYEDPNRKVFHLCIVNLVIGWVLSRLYKYTKCSVQHEVYCPVHSAAELR